MDLTVPFDRSFDGLIGVEHIELIPEGVVGRVVVRDELLGANGAVGSGVYSAISEGLTSTGTAIGVAGRGMIATGMSNETTVTELVSEGTLTARCTPIHKDDHTWLWAVEIRDHAGRLAAVSSTAIAVRPPPAGHPVPRSTF